MDFITREGPYNTTVNIPTTIPAIYNALNALLSFLKISHKKIAIIIHDPYEKAALYAYAG